MQQWQKNTPKKIAKTKNYYFPRTKLNQSIKLKNKNKKTHTHIKLSIISNLDQEFKPHKIKLSTYDKRAPHS